jgi:hypothetical protein
MIDLDERKTQAEQYIRKIPDHGTKAKILDCKIKITKYLKKKNFLPIAKVIYHTSIGIK